MNNQSVTSQQGNAIGKRDFPLLFRDADQKARENQSMFFKFVFIDLALVVLGSLCAGLAEVGEDKTLGLLIVSAILFAIAACTTQLVPWRATQQRWYDARTVAEEVKELTWKYMTCCPPFEKTPSGDAADKRFIDRLQAIADSPRGAALQSRSRAVGQVVGPGSQITTAMKNQRDTDFATRKELYGSERLDDQYKWYRRRSSRWQTNQRVAFGVVAICQLFSVILVVSAYFIGNDAGAVPVAVPGAGLSEDPDKISFSKFELTIGLAGTMAALAAAVFAWAEAKRYQELSLNYANVAQGLSFYIEKLNLAESEGELQTVVTNAERLISFEHSLWKRELPKVEATT